MYRKALSYSLLVIFIVGVVYILVPFTSSLQPSADALNKAPHLDLSSVKKGQRSEFKVPHFKIYISKLGNSKINAVAIPFRDGAYQLPEFNWQRPLLPCKSFIQDFGYQCLDVIDNKLVWYSYMKWDNNGNYIGENKWDKKIPNLLIPKYKIAAEQFIFLGL
jgi:hypothetical protein